MSEKVKTFIDEKGHLIGKQVNGNVLDGQGHMLARYIKGSNRTVDKAGKNIGVGDVRIKELGK